MPTLETINVGLAPNDKKGDPLRDAMQKVILNFSALNTAIQGVLDTKGQANGFASLGADGRLLAAQAPIVYAPVLPTTVHDLNTFVTPGTYYQAAVAGATAPTGVNYPVAQVGFLEVVAAGTPALQVYTTRNATPTIQQRFWRVRVTSSTWSAWKEVVDTTATLSYAGRLATAQDLNTFTTRGIWFASAASIATGGSNYPVGTAGFLLVLSESALGGAAQTSGVSQRYESVNGKVYTRYISGGVWSPWVTLIDSSVVGVASGVGSLDGNGRAPVTQFPMSLSLTAGTDANTVTAPGVYYTNSDAQATAVLNWPEQLAGTLNVEAAVSGNSQITQTYTTRNGTGGVSRTYKRVRFGGGAGVWGMWQQQARYDDAMTHVLLTTATDANTLTADNTFYTWRSGTVVVSGSNWAPVGTNVSGGHLEVRWAASDYVIQTVTIPISGAKPRIYQRFGSGTSWQAWKIISPVSSITWLPTADAGDVYVDGLGWHRWNGSAYELSSLATTLPTTAHDLNTYQTPGAYRQASTAGATAGSNYPVSIGGTLNVQGSGSSGQTVQTYILASTGAVTGTSGPRMFWRFAINTTWSPWTEVLSAALGMTHQFLTAATDANTLTADNTWYSWTSGTLMSSGSNFPAGVSAAGYMKVFWQAATIVSQELTVLVTGQKPRTFYRFGNSSTNSWQPWKSTSAQSTASFPTEDCGDIYVDGQGWYVWDGTSYKLTRAGMDHGQCRFLYVSTTQCRLVPQDGNGLIINGRQYRIPSSGVNIANTAGTNSVIHYVYAYDSAGSIALEASTTTHVLHTDGVRIKSGDPTRTLVGMFIKPSTGEFVFTGPLNYVTSWFNRAPRGIQQYFSASTASQNEAVQLHSGCSFLGWAGDTFRVSLTGITHATTSSGSYLTVRVNGTGGYGNYGYSVGPGIGQQAVAITVATGQATDTLYTLSPYGFTGSAGTTVTFGADLGVLYYG